MSRLLALLFTILLVSPCEAVIQAPVSLGTATAAAGANTLALTTIAACPIGDEIIVIAAASSTTTETGIADGASNAYTPGLAVALTGSAGTQKFFSVRSRVNAGLSLGGTITVTYNSTAGIKFVGAICVRGLNLIGSELDTEPTGTTGASTAPSITTATLAFPAEIIVCGYFVPGSSSTFTNTSGFSALPTITSSATFHVYWEYKIVSASTAVACAPTLGTSSTWGASAKLFIQSQGNKMFTGVGQ